MKTGKELLLDFAKLLFSGEVKAENWNMADVRCSIKDGKFKFTGPM